MTVSSPFRWVTELLCRLAGIDIKEAPAESPAPLVSPERLEAMLLGEMAPKSDPPINQMIVLHFAPILEPYTGRRDRLMTVLKSAAARAIADHLSGQPEALWIAEALVIRFGELPPAVDAVMGIAQRLFGADFDPSILPARLLGQHNGALAFADLWPTPAAQERLSARQSLAGTDPIEFSFQPMWSTLSKEVTGLICVPRRGGLDLTSDKLDLPADDVAAIDEQTIAHVVECLQHPSINGRCLGFPIHHATIVDAPRREQVLAPIMALPKAARALVIVEVVALGADCSRLKLASSLKGLHGVSSIMGRFHIGETNFTDLKAAGIKAVGTDISMSRRAEAELLPMLTEFTVSAGPSGLATYVQGTNSVSLKTAAVSAGFDIIAGMPLKDPLAPDLGGYPMSPRELYGKSLAGAA